MMAAENARSGLLLLDKPVAISSNAALQRVRRSLGGVKAGHAGTLDPLASGLLPILVGEATRLAALGLDAEKAYEAELCLGVRTSTGDAEGQPAPRRAVTASAGDVERALAGFRGPIEQVPPMHSALKSQGVPLYRLARAGQEVARTARRVLVHELLCTAFDGERLCLRIRCSKGTYVRTLADDLGEVLGCGAHVTALRRTRVGQFGLEEAVPIAVLETDQAPGRYLLPVERLVQGLPRVDLDESAALRFCRGQSVAAPAPLPEGQCAVFCGPALIGLGEAAPDSRIAPRRVFGELCKRLNPKEKPLSSARVPG